ncbi:hypothetical protein AB0451_39440 [Streptomyces sp. NPDC052000]|uniref:hypothetical protein n=1 Tax=Streptomyces sp. NPDC052000 TaxID=3155676 RepID=UPI00344D6D57
MAIAAAPAVAEAGAGAVAAGGAETAGAGRAAAARGTAAKKGGGAGKGGGKGGSGGGGEKKGPGLDDVLPTPGGGKKEPKGKGKPSATARARRWAWADNRRLLTAEFIACVVVLGLGTLLAPKGSKDGIPRLMIKGTALSGLFLLLALVASGGKGPARAATAIGTLVTAAYVLTSSDVHNVVQWIGTFFSASGSTVPETVLPPVIIGNLPPTQQASLPSAAQGGGPSVIQA